MKGIWLGIVMLICTLSLNALIPAEITPMPLPTDPDLVQGTLPNGLTYYILPNAKPEKRIELRLLVKAGSVQEDDDQLGLAHFVEHMAFNGSKNFPRTEMVEYLSSIGMGFHNGLNGGTSYDQTIYQFKLPTDDEAKLRKGLTILSDIAWQLSMDPSEIERERGIIQEEWRLGQDAQHRTGDAVDKVRLAGSRYALRNPIGTIENIRTFKPESLIRFYKDWYRPDLESVVIVGDYPTEALKAMIEQYFGVIPKRDKPRAKESYPVPDNPEPRAVVVLDKELPYTYIQATWKKEAEPIVDLGTYYNKLKKALFYQMFNARMQEIGMQPNAPFSYAVGFQQSWLREFAASTLMAIPTEGHSEDAMVAMLLETTRIREHGFKPGEFERAKMELIRYAETEVAKKPTRESDEAVWGLLSPIMDGSAILSAEQEEDLVKNIVGEIGLDEVNDIVDDMISSENLTLSLTGTDTPGAQYPTKERLLSIFNEIKNSEVEDYVDNTVDEPIMTGIPAPGKIVKQSVYPKSGIKKWVLSNGVTVYSKKTDFQSDEVLLSATSPGGSAMLNPDDVKAGQIISSYCYNSGFGNFDGPALQKALAGKVAYAYPTIDTYGEGWTGSCSPKDLELMFQMVYQRTIAPRFNQDTFNSTVMQLRAFVQNSLLDPENAFFDTLDMVVYNNHPIKRDLRPDDLDKATLLQLERVYRDRFADSSDFTFYIVGNFDEEQLKQYCQTYLANLPTVKRKDRIKDVGVRSFRGQKSVTFRKGDERSFTSNVTVGKYSNKAADSAALRTMLVIANEKLRENVRENLSGVYTIQAWSVLDRYPKSEYLVKTWMSCDPEKATMLNDAAFATMDSIEAGLYDQKYVDTAKTTMQKTYEESIKTNRYWINNMTNNVFKGYTIDQFLDTPKYLDKMNKKALTKAAKKYLSFDKNKLSVTMMPIEQ
jgi:zinc protease